MDPDANIANQRLLITRLQIEPSDQDARTGLAELTGALRGWLACGGFSPAAPDWRQVQAVAGRLLSRH